MDFEEMHKAYNRATSTEKLKILADNKDFRLQLKATKTSRSKEEEIILYQCKCLFQGSTPLAMCKDHVQQMWKHNQELQQRIAELMCTLTTNQSTEKKDA